MVTIWVANRNLSTVSWASIGGTLNIRSTSSLRILAACAGQRYVAKVPCTSHVAVFAGLFSSSSSGQPGGEACYELPISPHSS